MMSAAADKTLAPYSRLAAFYDGMMEHVDYGHWAKYIDGIFRRTGSDVKQIYECACGTGTLALALSRMGYRLTCSDRSYDMIRIARTKAVNAGYAIDFSICDMTEVKSDKQFDAVICLYDSINYLDDKQKVTRFIQNAETLLRNGGLFIFDACTERNSLEHFDQRYEFDKTHRYRRRSYYLKEQKLQVNEITLEIDGTFFTETHHQKIYPMKDIETMIGQSGFRLEHVFADLTYQKGSEKSERVHFVLRKPKAGGH